MTEPKIVQHCRALLQGTDYSVVKEQPNDSGEGRVVPQLGDFSTPPLPRPDGVSEYHDNLACPECRASLEKHS